MTPYGFAVEQGWSCFRHRNDPAVAAVGGVQSSAWRTEAIENRCGHAKPNCTLALRHLGDAIVQTLEIVA
jgi:hypothetical protein